MKILLLHLSDLHIDGRDIINILKIDKAIESLNVLGNFDECLIICSGDIANTGSENDYKKAIKFFGNIIAQLKRKLEGKFIRLIVVPGNHDANFTNVKRTSTDILKYYKHNTIDDYIDDEIKMFKNFYDYSSHKSISLFNINKFIDVKIIKYDNLVLQLNLINSAFFSTLIPDDKELHYFPEGYLNLLKKKAYSDLVITIMHHSTESFNWNSKKLLEDFIYKHSSILFLGHDHIIKDKDLFAKYRNTVIFAGGKFDVKSLLEDSEFSAILLDTTMKNINSYSFIWDKNNNLFNHEKGFVNKSLIIYNNFINPKSEYVQYLKSDEKHQICDDFTKYFVFPALSLVDKREYAEKLVINDINTFINKLNEIKRINIVGNNNSGKTALLKYLFLKLSSMKVPIFFTIDDIRDKEIDKVVRPLFEEQYSDNSSDYEQFLQLERCDKIAIVDDIDKIKSDEIKERFINKLKEKFGYLIISSKNDVNFNLVEDIQNQMDSKNEIYILEIEDFYLKKRTVLIENVCKAKNCLNTTQINKIKNKINKYIQNEIKVFELNPDFIIQYILYFIEDITDSYARNDVVFSKVFETNINTAIIKNTNANLINQSFVILEELAYYIHFNRKYPITIEEFENIVSKYNYDYDEEVNAKKIQEMLCNAKIIKILDSSYSLRFCNTNYLAFFVAKSLKRKYNDTHSSKDLEIVLKNIGFDINAHVMLFFSYIDSNQNVVMQIYNNAEENMANWTEFKLDECNINYLNNARCISEIKAPTSQDKQEADKINDYNEREVKNNNLLIECRDIYDYDESEIKKLSFQIKSAIKYTEFLAKSLPSLGYMLLKDNKLKILSSIFEYPNKIIYKYLHPIDENFKEIVTDFKEFADENELTGREDKNIDEEYIEKLIIDNSICLILNVYNKFAHILADPNSIKLLENYKNSDNTNYRIFNIMVTENNCNTEKLIKQIDELLSENKEKITKNMLIQIIRKHLIYNENIPYYTYQKIIQKYFRNVDLGIKKGLLLDRYKKQNK